MNKLYCIACPAGCLLSVREFGYDDVEVEGNGCEMGIDFARSETTNPMRTLTTTVRTTFPGVPVFPVRTDGEIPKGKIIEAMVALSKIVVGSELGCGDTVVENIVGSGVRVIATSDALTADSRSAEPIGKNAQFDDVLSIGVYRSEEQLNSSSDDYSEPDAEDEEKESGRPHIRN
ncbi:MAG: DUF1667 domain-containing protein [Oscillospiraceae bacterium]|nr:DUF1667 domain-containing protein [Oscillospiraceae bacterium]